MKKNKILSIGSSVFGITASIFALNVAKINISYALPSIPVTTFTTNNQSIFDPAVVEQNQQNQIINLVNANNPVFNAVKGLKVNNTAMPLYVIQKNRYVARTGIEEFAIGGTTGNPTAVNDAGLKKIMIYGFNNCENNLKSVFNTTLSGAEGVTLSDDEKHYVTQLAIWMYMFKHQNEPVFESSYCGNKACGFYNNFDDANNEVEYSYNDILTAVTNASNNNTANGKKLKYALKLLQIAEDDSTLSEPTGDLVGVNKTELSDKSKYDFSNDEYLLTGKVNLTNVDTSRFLNWGIQINNAGYDVSITDANGNPINGCGTNTTCSGFNKDQVIRFKIKYKDNLSSMNLKDIGITLKFNSFAISKTVVNEYRVTASSDQNIIKRLSGDDHPKIESFSKVMLARLDNQESTDNLELINFTDIEKIELDEDGNTTGNTVGGAHLIIIPPQYLNQDGTGPLSTMPENVIYDQWDTVEGKSHKTLLAPGEYYVCETVVPDGYEPAKCKKLVVPEDATSVTVFKYENKLLDIPDTGMFKKNGIYIIGGCLVIFGAIGMGIIINKGKKNKVQQSM